MTQIGLYTTNPLAYTPPYGLPLTSYRPLMDSQTVSYTKRVPNCQKCGQHGRKSRLKGHKRVCPYRDCNCAKWLLSALVLELAAETALADSISFAAISS
ncbi:unnamed protein product [Toxocara canis]|uniref:DM domain-containing protein n=1 Tax=Toxocara canis TaxID=6265 RepID=A0A183UP58_TOXCA|nr:unnamed protein product [Toxocara canis]